MDQKQNEQGHSGEGVGLVTFTKRPIEWRQHRKPFSSYT